MDFTPDIENAYFVAQSRMAQLGTYYEWILRNFGSAIGRRIWDAGAGVGNIVAHLAKDAELVLATEFTQQNLITLQSRFKDMANVRVAFYDLMADEGISFKDLELDTIITLDVLEHLEDDLKALRTFYQVLKPGGRLLIKVPAHMFLYGTIDKASLHYRRYAKNELQLKLIKAGFHIEKIRHMNMAATLPYFIKGKILKRNRNFSLGISPKRFGLYNTLIPLFEKMEHIIPPFFGLSLIVIAQKLYNLS